MTVRGGAVQKNHNPILYINKLFPLNHLFFIMDDCLSHILESTKVIAMKLGL